MLYFDESKTYCWLFKGELEKCVVLGSEEYASLKEDGYIETRGISAEESAKTIEPIKQKLTRSTK